MNELQWVDFLKKHVNPGRNVVVGIGDDCAQVKVGKEKLLLKSDLFIEDVHFKRRDISLFSIANRAVGRVLSDFAACGGVPLFLGVSIGIGSLSSSNLKQLLKGVVTCSKKYKFAFIGGDTAKSKKVFLDVWGVGRSDKCVLRSTAKVGDHIFITGLLGKRPFNASFVPRIKEAQFLVKNFKVNAMIDISDGFIIDLYRILQASKKGALLEGNLPVTNGKSDLYRGEDYELIFTIDKSSKNIDVLRKRFHFVGRIKPNSFGYKNRRGDVKINGYTHL
ncbi:MAG: thiamine-monophosphate kinase [Candidatus Omnitrophica bacterium]|nr:thiamine-monophosphate kinase [Candidatus Omnitrophota bacterium]